MSEAQGPPVSTAPPAQAATGGPGYQPRNILVTGGAGFIGSHVVILLAKKYPQYNIINLDKLDYCSSLKNLEQAGLKCSSSVAKSTEHGDSVVGTGNNSSKIAGVVSSKNAITQGGDGRGVVRVPGNYKFVKGDICSPDLINFIFSSESIDTVLHFAAQTHVDNSFGNSFSFTRNNVLGTHVLLEASKLHGVSRFIHVSTDEVYGEGAPDGSKVMLEEHVLEPTNPYAATKAAAEFLVKAYHRSFSLPVIITRGNNVYGPHQFPEKLIPKFINQLRRGERVTLHGDGHNSRNYLYVEDVARAFDIILHRGDIGSIYNIGGTNELTNFEVAKNLIQILCGVEGDEAIAKHVKYVEDRAFNDLRYQIDSTRLHSLGWKESVSWKDGIQKTVEWYLGHLANWPGELVEAALQAHPRMLGSEGNF